MIRYHEIEQGTDEWQELRAGKYTGSNADKLLKFGAIDYSLTETGKFHGNFWTKRGHILEDEAIELYQRITGLDVKRVGFVTNDSFANCGYSPDGILADRLIEVKCFDTVRHLMMHKGEIPLKVLAQVHFGMLVCEVKTAHLLIYNPDLDVDKAFKIIEIKANRNIENNFKRILRKEPVHANSTQAA